MIAEKEEDIYVEQPPGFEFPLKGSQIVYKVLGGLLGLKHSGDCWKGTLGKFLTEFGPTRSLIHSFCYSKNDLRVNRRFVCLWVHDIINNATLSDLAEAFRKCFSEKLRIEDKDTTKWFLGVSAEHSPGEKTISQK